MTKPIKNEKKATTPEYHPRFAGNMSALIRKDTFEDKEYLVIPVVLMAEGVHNKVLYTAEELSKFAEAWNA